MSIIVYAPESNKHNFEFLLSKVISRHGLENFDSIDALLARLRKPKNSVEIAILYLTAKEELSRIVEYKDLLSDIRTILVAPDRDENTVAKAHQLHPRFLSYKDNDVRIIEGVIKKMLF